VSSRRGHRLPRSPMPRPGPHHRDRPNAGRFCLGVRSNFRGRTTVTGISTLSSLSLALFIAGAFGPLLGRISSEGLSGRGFSNLLTDSRGAFLPFFVAPLLIEITPFPPWTVIGIVIGVTQAIAIG